MSKIKQDGGKQRNVTESKDKSNAGRKSKYYTHIQPYLDHIAQLRRNGGTLEQIAQMFQVSVDSVCEYQKKHSEFAECLKTNANIAILAVENALFKNATSGNLGAQIFYLKNRASKQWRDKQHVFQASSTVVRKDYDLMTDEELENEMNMLEGVVPDESVMDDYEGKGEVH